MSSLNVTWDSKLSYGTRPTLPVWIFLFFFASGAVSQQLANGRGTAATVLHLEGNRQQVLEKVGDKIKGYSKRPQSDKYFRKVDISKLFRTRRDNSADSNEQDGKRRNSSLPTATSQRVEEIRENYTAQNASQVSSTCAAFLKEKNLANKCIIIERYCEDSGGLFFNYLYIANCLLGACPFLVRLGFLLTIVVFLFYLLGDTAEEYFCPTVAKFSSLLKLSPTTAGVTFLAFGNGAPDVFSSLLAFTTGGTSGEVGIGALVSAGSFVTAIVVGCVAYAGFKTSGEVVKVNRRAFLRDVSFYLGAVCLSFVIYISGKVYLWHGIALLAYYSVFVVTVMYSKEEERLDSYSNLLDLHPNNSTFLDKSSSERPKNLVYVDPLENEFHSFHDKENTSSCLSRMIGWSKKCFRALGATIPSIEWNENSKYRLVSSIFFCPLLLLIPLDPIIHSWEHILPLMPSRGIFLPLWSLVGIHSWCLAILVGILTANKNLDRSMNSCQQHSTPTNHVGLVQWGSCCCAFMMSILWISDVNGTGICNELIACLGAIGISLGLSPTFLGLTILAWGNSIGDLFADVAMAKNGMPTTAIAGCYAGPLFNMMVGLGLSVTIKTLEIYPKEITFKRNMSVITSYGALATGLIGAAYFVTENNVFRLIIVRAAKFKLPVHLGLLLVVIYGSSVVANVIGEWEKHFD